MAEKSILQSLQENSSADVMNVIYDNVNRLLGAGNQLFVMEFPARPGTTPTPMNTTPTTATAP